jgi:hypothetical protein
MVIQTLNIAVFFTTFNALSNSE